MRDAIRARSAGHWPAGPLAARRARLPRIHRRSALAAARATALVRHEKPALVHGSAGRAGADELLRAARGVLSAGSERGGRARRGILTRVRDCSSAGTW